MNFLNFSWQHNKLQKIILKHFNKVRYYYIECNKLNAIVKTYSGSWD